MKPKNCPKCGSDDIGKLDIPGYTIKDLPRGYSEEDYVNAGGRWYCVTCAWISERGWRRT